MNAAGNHMYYLILIVALLAAIGLYMFVKNKS